MSENCGHGPEAFDPESDGTYEVEILRCFHCTALNRARAKWVREGGDLDDVTFRVTRRAEAEKPIVLKVDGGQVWRALIDFKRGNGGAGLGLG